MKSIVKSLSTLILLSIITACGGAPSVHANIAESNKQRETNPRVAEGDMENLVHGNNTFALDIYESLRAQDGNMILSPYSISLALAMTYAGARGESDSQMAQSLHFDLPQGQLHPAFNTLDLALEKTPTPLENDLKPMQLKIANAVWAEQTYSFLQEFLDTISINYGAGINLADFVNQFEPARKEINAWVSDKTEDKINDLLPGNSVNSNTRMVLVNAIYFKADWLAQFDVNSTGEAPFHLLDGSEVNVSTMNRGMEIPYATDDGWQMIELSYAGETAAMDILVPDSGRFDEIESNLNVEAVSAMLTDLQPLNVMLSLPKFKFESTYQLPDTLSGMGMKDAFDGSLADFSGMTGDKDLFIGNVIHKAFVAVDEKGTEAAAATAVIMEGRGAPSFDISLQVDRPFIFIIRDTANGQILFIGRVTNPAG